MSGASRPAELLATATPLGTVPTIKKEDDLRNEEDVLYNPRPPLGQPKRYLRDLKFLINALNKTEIDLDPAYQRAVVWTADRMSGLIDSLMENYYIPPIIFNRNTVTKENGEQPKSTLICVDGKQRLSSIKAFVAGTIPCHDQNGGKWWFSSADPQGKSHTKILPEWIRKQFLDKEFVIVEYCDLSSCQEEDLFSRVQMGVQLTPAEKMRATTGPWQELAQCFVTDFPTIYSLLKDRTRAKDFQLTLACFCQIVEVLYPTAADGTPMARLNYIHLSNLLKNKGIADDGIKSRLANTWNMFQELIRLDEAIFTNSDKRLKGVQTFAPAEMVAVTVLISMYSDTRSNKLLLSDIQALRNALRDEFGDIRMNHNLWKFVWNFLNKLKDIRGQGDDGMINQALQSSSNQRPRSVPMSTSAATGTKRLRSKSPPSDPRLSMSKLFRRASPPPGATRADAICIDEAPVSSSQRTRAPTPSSSAASPYPMIPLPAGRNNISFRSSVPVEKGTQRHITRPRGPMSGGPITSPSKSHERLVPVSPGHIQPTPPSAQIDLARKSAKRSKKRTPMIPQYDGVIDLTLEEYPRKEAIEKEHMQWFSAPSHPRRDGSLPTSPTSQNLQTVNQHDIGSSPIRVSAAAVPSASQRLGRVPLPATLHGFTKDPSREPLHLEMQMKKIQLNANRHVY